MEGTLQVSKWLGNDDVSSSTRSKSSTTCKNIRSSSSPIVILYGTWNIFETIKRKKKIKAEVGAVASYRTKEKILKDKRKIFMIRQR